MLATAMARKVDSVVIGPIVAAILRKATGRCSPGNPDVDARVRQGKGGRKCSATRFAQWAIQRREIYGRGDNARRTAGVSRREMRSDHPDSRRGAGRASRFLLGFGIALLDADNDGRLDLATANGHVNDDRPDYPYDMPALLMMGRGTVD